MIKPDWPAAPTVHALVTTRVGGVSAGPWASFNLGANCGDLPAHVEENRRRLNALLPAPPCWLRQVHGTGVVRLGKRPVSNARKSTPTGDGESASQADVAAADEFDSETIAADAAVTRQAGRVCAVLTADCLPVLLCDRAGTEVAAAHAGWRGLAAGILENTVQHMDAPGEDLMAWLGPAIGPQKFQVGDDVLQAFVEQDPRAQSAFVKDGSRWLADLYPLARLALQRAGVTRIDGGGLCTSTDEARFFSYRRDGDSGRMASLIWLQQPAA